MNWFTWIRNRWNQLRGLQGPGSLQDLYQRLGLPTIQINTTIRGFSDAHQLKPDEIPLGYWWHKVPKREGATRLLHSPTPPLKRLQRLLLRKLFKKLRVHPCAKGFRRGESIVTHARLHARQAVLVRMDIQDFFHSTKWPRLESYFRALGWKSRARRLLCQLCTHQSRLPQGAPTSPILSNLVNFRMDARLAGLAKKSGAIYSRYADDIIFSFAQDDRRFIRGVIRRVRRILWENGYRMHGQAKLRILRRHQRQIITGLVVNDKVQLPRKTRRWLRAIEHHLRAGRPVSLTPAQLQGWRSLQKMIERQGKK